MLLKRRIRQLREAHGMNQSEFADLLGVNRAQVSRWERGENPSLESLRSILEKTGVSADWLLCVDEHERNGGEEQTS